MIVSEIYILSSSFLSSLIFLSSLFWRIEKRHLDEASWLPALRMHNSQNYTMKDIHDADVLRIMHRGLIGGWLLEDRCGFAPETLCGLFIFCRYIELENEFIIV